MAEDVLESRRQQPELHSSDLTLKALTAKFDWLPVNANGDVEKSFEGMGSADDESHGSRTLHASYGADKRRQYITVFQGDKELLNIDGRGRDPSDVARELNRRVEAIVAHQRSLTGYSQIEPNPAAALDTLIRTVNAGDEDRVENLLRSKATLSVLDARDKNGFTALHHAAIRNNRIAELLVAAGASPGMKTPGGMSPQDLRTLGGLSQQDLLGPQASELLELQKGLNGIETSVVQPSAEIESSGQDSSVSPTADDPFIIKEGRNAGAQEDDEVMIKRGTNTTNAGGGGNKAQDTRTLLNGLYVANEAGEYTRIGQSKIAIIDGGAQITLKTREIETFRAAIELVKNKGWSSIEVGGANRYRQAAWLEGRVEGLAVQGYEPTEKDLAMLDRRMAEKALSESIAEGRPSVVAKSLEDAQVMALAFKKSLVAPNLKSGLYAGRVFAESSHHVLVTVDGRSNTATAIEKAKLDGVKYRVGEMLHVQFKDGALVPGRSHGQTAKMTR